MNRRFDDVNRHSDKRFDDMHRHFDKRFDGVNKRIDALEGQQREHGVTLVAMGREVAKLAGRVDELAGIVSCKGTARSVSKRSSCSVRSRSHRCRRLKNLG